MTGNIKPGDIIPGMYPSYYSPKDIQEERRLSNPKLRTRRDRDPVKAVVEYVHPQGRFVTLRFWYGNGSFCESKLLRGETP